MWKELTAIDNLSLRLPISYSLQAIPPHYHSLNTFLVPLSANPAVRANERVRVTEGAVEGLSLKAKSAILTLKNFE